jgi:general secretion pathway protein A
VFLKFFGLKEQPFGVTPDPRYLYLSLAHREALASMFYGIETGRGFLSLIAKPGMGKTTLLFHLLEKFRTSARTAFLFQTQCTSREFMRFLLAELGCETTDHDFVRMHEEFNRLLLREARAGNRFIVMIDEAQNLSPSVLETIRLLSDFETPRAKLLQIVLAGQPELADKLVSANLSQLRQRISIVSSLRPFSLEDTKKYIEYRLQMGGYTGPELFTPEAFVEMAEFSQGIPRNINNFCFNAMSLACSVRKSVIDVEIVREVMADLDISQHTSQPGERSARAMAKASEGEPGEHEWTDPRENARGIDPDVLAEARWKKMGKDASLTPEEARAYLEQFVRFPSGPKV